MARRRYSAHDLTTWVFTLVHNNTTFKDTKTQNKLLGETQVFTMTKKLLLTLLAALAMTACVLAAVDAGELDNNNDGVVVASFSRRLFGWGHHSGKDDSSDKKKKKKKKDKFKCPKKCKKSECCKCLKKKTKARTGAHCTTEDGLPGVCKGKYVCKPKPVTPYPPPPPTPMDSSPPPVTPPSPPADKCTDADCKGNCAKCDPSIGCIAYPGNCKGCAECKVDGYNTFNCKGDDDECDDEPCQTGTCKVYGVYGRCKYEDVYDGQRCTPNVVTASDGGPYYVCCSGECVPGTTCTPPPDLCKDVRCGNCGKCIEWDGRAKCVEKEDACKGCAVCEKNNGKYECEGDVMKCPADDDECKKYVCAVEGRMGECKLVPDNEGGECDLPSIATTTSPPAGGKCCSGECRPGGCPGDPCDNECDPTCEECKNGECKPKRPYPEECGDRRCYNKDVCDVCAVAGDSGLTRHCVYDAGNQRALTCSSCRNALFDTNGCKRDAAGVGENCFP